MSSGLETNLRTIYSEKKNKIIPGNIKKDVTIFGITGTYDGPTLPYGRMLDNLDNINNTQISLRQDLSAITFVGDISGYSTTSGESYPITDCKIDSHSSMAVLANQGDVAIAIGLTADKIKNGVTILGITGTYSDAMKEYASETAMNNDIANIQEGEVVKVVNQGITTYYVKEISTTTEYQAVDLSQYEEGDTISIKNMKLNSTVTLPTSVGRIDDRDFTLSYNNIKVLECKITSQISIDYAGVSVNDTDNYMFIDNNPTFSLADNDLQAINSSEIWQSNNQLTISGSEFSDYTGILLEPVEIFTEVMTKLVKESETISPQDFEEVEEQIGDLFGEEENN